MIYIISYRLLPKHLSWKRISTFYRFLPKLSDEGVVLVRPLGLQCRGHPEEVSRRISEEGLGAFP